MTQFMIKTTLLIMNVYRLAPSIIGVNLLFTREAIVIYMTTRNMKSILLIQKLKNLNIRNKYIKYRCLEKVKIRKIHSNHLFKLEKISQLKDNVVSLLK